MYNILIKRSGDGKCVSTGHLPNGYQLKEGEECVLSHTLDPHLFHHEPYKSKHKYLKIKEKQKQIISEYSYIPGLSVGMQEDTAWKNWIESIILFDEQYKSDKSIADVIYFPADPLGNTEVLDFNE